MLPGGAEAPPNISLLTATQRVDIGRDGADLRFRQARGAAFGDVAPRGHDARTAVLDGLGQGRDNAKQFLKDNPEIANDIEGQIRANADKLYATRRPAGRAVAAAEKPTDPAAAKEPVVKAPTRSSESELDIMVED